ncbi:MAG: hypothetical protein HKN16_04660 [Saprospiraceae bacterium]|nr:hypothetical protein [Saprospiraceae bacterium]
MNINLKAFGKNGTPDSSDGSFFLKNLPFILFITLMLVFYIANSHSAEKKIRLIQDSQKEVKSLRWEYLSLHSDYMQQTQRSEIVKTAGIHYLDVPKHPVKKIVVANK